MVERDGGGAGCPASAILREKQIDHVLPGKITGPILPGGAAILGDQQLVRRESHGGDHTRQRGVAGEMPADARIDQRGGPEKMDTRLSVFL